METFEIIPRDRHETAFLLQGLLSTWEETTLELHNSNIQLVGGNKIIPSTVKALPIAG